MREEVDYRMVLVKLLRQMGCPLFMNTGPLNHSGIEWTDAEIQVLNELSEEAHSLQ